MVTYKQSFDLSSLVTDNITGWTFRYCASIGLLDIVRDLTYSLILLCNGWSSPNQLCSCATFLTGHNKKLPTIMSLLLLPVMCQFIITFMYGNKTHYHLHLQLQWLEVKGQTRFRQHTWSLTTVRVYRIWVWG